MNLNKIITISYIIFFISFSTNLFSQNPNTYLNYKGNCKITFPNTYTKKESVTKGGLVVTKVQTQKDGNAYMFSFNVHNENITKIGTDKILDVSINAFNNRLKGRIMKTETFYYNNGDKKYKGKEIKTYIAKSNYYVFYRAMIINRIQYQIIIITKDENKNSVGNSFFNSFVQLKKH